MDQTQRKMSCKPLLPILKSQLAVVLQTHCGREKKQSEKGKSKADSTARENTSPTASDSSPGVTQLRAREFLSSQIKLDIANSLHSLSLNFAAMAQHFGVGGTVTVPARECPSTWDGVLQAEHDLVHGISEEVEYDEEDEESLFAEEEENEMDISS
ncbi:hypothetical protein TRIATDRAFT_132759 [Trichoderma atroviride IMI 206040]|uniref:Uncharacterized protein n=1 Tax=Hypocrea atroviridis (strain ATCC 20476 / IMI 206040) TaxID=452589 RepID=G9NG81_HYPAI|nr:uncharacterized protein TRIATDRAFT_132759 [Trichoderma atroviride IMI 206040]EHK50293.1 hypothetical protein TRIATDRAFT_132759 [Trichoderma atroviride IMI 206040]